MRCWRPRIAQPLKRPLLTQLTVPPLGCVPHARVLALRAMASNNAFASATVESPIGRSHFFMSSSPDLPSVNELLSQRSRAPPFRVSPRRPAGVLERPRTTESQSLSATIESRAGVQLPDEDKNTAIEIEDVSLVEIEAETFRKARESRQRGQSPEAPTGSQQVSSPLRGPKPWKKFKLKDGAPMEETDEGSQNVKEKASLALAEAASLHGNEISQGESLHLEPAMTRKLHWTPPSKQNLIMIDSSSPLAGPSGLSEKPTSRAREFEQLLQSYKCTEGLRQEIPATSDEESSFLKKRKLIELVTATSNEPTPAKEKAPTRPKATKKKPRTITEVATAAYRSETPPPALSTTSKQKAQSSTEKKDEGSAKTKKAPAKTRKRVVKKKPTTPPQPALLPPDEALREVANQDFLFGTSSQLALEKSPTFLRYLQTAMKESNEMDVIDLEPWRSSDAEDAPRPRSRPKLWNAGARDEDGDLFDVEVSNLANRSFQKVSDSQEKDDPFGYLQGAEKPATVELADDGFNSSALDDPFADTTDLPAVAALESKPSGPADMTENNQSKLKRDDSWGSSSLAEGTPSITGATAAQNSAAAVRDVDLVEPQRPSYDLLTDAQLAKEIKSYGFKPVRLRKARIALLEQCWESRARTGHPSVGVGNAAGFATRASRSKAKNQEPVTPEGKKRRGRPRKESDNAPEDPYEPPPSAQPRDSPVRPRGRSKKAAANTPATSSTTVKAKRGRPRKKATAAALEIPDSASDGGESDSSIGGRSPREASFSPPLVDFSSAADEAGAGSGSQMASTFSYVTRAVRSAPRTTDPAKPSWHEKMLLYDPIILEDLTAWLNGGELGRVGYDGKVSVADVKRWCESRSICCLKRENLRGQERKRY